jgi:hypothetical protein
MRGDSGEGVRAKSQLPSFLPHSSIDDCDADGIPYFVMPYVDGESLRTRLSRGGSSFLPE